MLNNAEGVNPSINQWCLLGVVNYLKSSMYLLPPSLQNPPIQRRTIEARVGPVLQCYAKGCTRRVIRRENWVACSGPFWLQLRSKPRSKPDLLQHTGMKYLFFNKIYKMCFPLPCLIARGSILLGGIIPFQHPSTTADTGRYYLIQDWYSPWSIRHCIP